MTDQPDNADRSDDPHLGETAERLARRPWPTTPIRSGLEVSFEFFPTATADGATKLSACLKELAPLGPSFVSVTYGAGGSSRERTVQTLSNLGETAPVPLAGHLTTVAAAREETLAMVDTYLAMGVRHIVALRGDPPTDGPSEVPDGFATAADLVAGIRDHVGDAVEISVAAYPETHPRADSPETDIDRLKEKIDAGADRAITQFFFDNDAFCRFQDRCRQASISVPIVPGIMPIGSFTKMVNFAGRCGTSIPAWMPELFAGLGDAPEVHRMVSATVAAEQCRELAERGVRNFHFYTMNRPELTAATCRILGLRPSSAETAADEAGGGAPDHQDRTARSA